MSHAVYSDRVESLRMQILSLECSSNSGYDDAVCTHERSVVIAR